MKYLYKCENDSCSNLNKEITIDKPIADSSKEEYCTICKESLTRIYAISSIVTGDGVK